MADDTVAVVLRRMRRQQASSRATGDGHRDFNTVGDANRDSTPNFNTDNGSIDCDREPNSNLPSQPDAIAAPNRNPKRDSYCKLHPHSK